MATSFLNVDRTKKTITTENDFKLQVGSVDVVTQDRTINGKSLAADINLTPADVGAVSLTGDQTIAGNKTFSGNVALGTGLATYEAVPVAANQVTNKLYVDYAIGQALGSFDVSSFATVNTVQDITAAKVFKANLSVTGAAVNFAGATSVIVPTPSVRVNAATKGYVDDGLDGKLSLTGGSLTGPLTVSGQSINPETGDGNLMRVNGPRDQQIANALDGKLNKSVVSNFGGSLIDDPDAAAARNTLGLGSAATRTATNYKSSAPLMEQTNVDFRGVTSYDVPLEFPVGLSGGIQNAGRFGASGDFVSVISCIGWPDYSGFGSMSQWYASNEHGGIGVRVTYAQPDNSVYFRTVRIWNANNTTVDANGFIKSASPIVRVGASNIVDDGDELCGDGVCNFEASGVTVTKTGLGEYIVSGSLGFAKEGWYIETPTDANGNKLRYVEYEDVDGEISIKTYFPNYQNGRCEKGSPADIPAGRWIDVRLDMPSKDPE